ncbi:MAG: hypothetical protein ACR2I8_08455 [Steroidobacteraceae bacterium]
MITSFQQTGATGQATSEPVAYPASAARDARALHGARTHAQAPSLVERLRTFIDRTLDAAFGRFDA